MTVTESSRRLPVRPASAPSRLARRALRAAALLTAAGSLAPAVASAELVTALPATHYRESVGVQTHFGFVNYAYDRETTARIGAMLRELGVRHVRDDACLAKEEECVRPRARMAELKTALGPGSPEVRFLMGITREVGTHPDRAVRDADIERALTALTKPPLAGMVSAVEGTNEPDLQNKADWAQRTVADDVTIRRLLAEPRFAALAGLPYLTPPLGRPTATAALLAAGWKTAGTVPNFHPYPPSWGGPENGLDVPCQKGVLALACAKMLGTAGAPMATETGYTTAGYNFSPSWVSERAQSVYLPRLLVDNFSRGVSRSYLYELIDLRPDKLSATNGFGLWRARYSGTNLVSGGPKPAVAAIARTNARIGDLGALPRWGGLDIDFRDAAGGIVPPTSIKRSLLRRADGSYVLAMWQPQSVFNSTQWQQKDLKVADKTVTLAINSGVTGDWQATQFRPSIDGNASQSRGVKQVKVNVGADLTLVDLRSATSTDPIPGGAVTLAPNDPTQVTPPAAQ